MLITLKGRATGTTFIDEDGREYKILGSLHMKEGYVTGRIRETDGVLLIFRILEIK